MAAKGPPVVGYSRVTRWEKKEMTWVLVDRADEHTILAAANASSPVVHLGNGNVAFRYFIRPFEVSHSLNGTTVCTKYYSLCVELLEVGSSCIVEVTASTSISSIRRNESEGQFSTNNAKKGAKLVVIEDFIPVTQWSIGTNGVRDTQKQDSNHWQFKLLNEENLNVSLTASPYTLRCNDNTKSVTASVPKQSESEACVLSDLRTLALSHENFADLKLETRDNMTLSTHKFYLFARSPVFKQMLVEAMKKEDFDGTLNIPDVDAKPMMIILHWVYTGELHENVAKFIEQVVDASIKYKLNDLLKTLDKKLITFCNPENMLVLLQTAKKYALRFAMGSISAYVKEHL